MIRTIRVLGALGALCCATAFAQDGTIDLTFGVGGRQDFRPVVGHAKAITANVVSAFDDGSILIAGYEDHGLLGPSGPNSRVFMAKMLRDGARDALFGNDEANPGVTVLDDLNPGSTIQEAKAIIPLADGSTIIAGSLDAFLTGGFVLKIDAAGHLVESFGNAGVALFPFQIHDAAIDSQERVVVVGYARGSAPAYRSVVARLEGASGALDTSFDEDGVFELLERDDGGAVIDHSGELHAVALMEGDDIVVGGYQELGGPAIAFSLARLHNGKLDETFANGGWMRFVPDWTTSSSNDIRRVVIAANGDILFAANFTEDKTGMTYPTIGRFTAEGVPRASFGNEDSPGFRRLDVLSGYAVQLPTGLAEQRDGRIVYTATAYDPVLHMPSPLIAGRLDALGATDAGFSNGPITPPAPPIAEIFAYAQALTLQDDQPVIVGRHGYPLDPEKDPSPVLIQASVLRLANDSLFANGFDAR